MAASFGMLTLPPQEPEQAAAVCADLTCIPNPDRPGAERNKYTLWSTSKTRQLKVPLGYAGLKAMEVQRDGTTQGMKLSPHAFTWTLRDSEEYPQRQAYRAVLDYFRDHAPCPAQVNLPCRSGKSVTAMAIGSTLGRRIAILVPRADIMRQFKKLVLAAFGGKLSVGFVQGPKQEVDRDVVVMMIPTLTSMIKRFGMIGTRKLLALHTFGTVIGDECHHLVARAQSNVPRLFNARYVLYMTATPMRNDGLTAQLEYLLGPKVFVGKRRTDFSDLILITYEGMRDAEPSRTEGEIDYHETCAMIHKHGGLRELCCQLAVAAVLRGHTVILYTLRMRDDKSNRRFVDEYAERCRELLFHTPIEPHMDKAPADVAVPLVSAVTGESKVADRVAARFSRIIVCTTGMFAEGSDIPWLSCIVLVGGNRSEPKSQQMVERHATLFEGKPRPLLFDINIRLDEVTGFETSQYTRIRKLYTPSRLPRTRLTIVDSGVGVARNGEYESIPEYGEPLYDHCYAQLRASVAAFRARSSGQVSMTDPGEEEDDEDMFSDSDA